MALFYLNVQLSQFGHETIIPDSNADMIKGPLFNTLLVFLFDVLTSMRRYFVVLSTKKTSQNSFTSPLLSFSVMCLLNASLL